MYLEIFNINMHMLKIILKMMLTKEMQENSLPNI